MMQFHPIPVKLSYFRSLPPIQSNRLLLVNYMTSQNIPLPMTPSVESFQELYQLIANYYQTKVNHIIRSIRAFRIKRQYLQLLSLETELNFSLHESQRQLIKSDLGGNRKYQSRRLANQFNFTDGTKIADLDPPFRFVCREGGRLYAFDLRELIQISGNMNPYTNTNFSRMTLLLLKLRVSQCPSHLLKLDRVVSISIDQQITDLVTVLELNGGYYLDIGKVKELTEQSWLSVVTNVCSQMLINSILSSHQRQILNGFSSVSDYQINLIKEQCVQLLLAIAQYEDSHKFSRSVILTEALMEHSHHSDFVNDLEASFEPEQLARLHHLMVIFSALQNQGNRELIWTGEVGNPDLLNFEDSETFESTISDIDMEEVEQVNVLQQSLPVQQSSPIQQDVPLPVQQGHTYNLRSSKRQLDTNRETNNDVKRSRR
jgi:hypothetical protein